MDERLTKGAIKPYGTDRFVPRWLFATQRRHHEAGAPIILTYYQIAKDECNDIIGSGQHNLNPSFRAPLKDQVCRTRRERPQGELMFQASGIGLTGAEDTKLGYYNGPRVNNLGNSSVNPLSTYHLYLFDSTDQRRDVTIAHYFTTVTGTRTGQAITNMNDGKFRRDWITNLLFHPPALCSTSV